VPRSQDQLQPHRPVIEFAPEALEAIKTAAKAHPTIAKWLKAALLNERVRKVTGHSLVHYVLD
jgi:hypothetical protein